MTPTCATMGVLGMAAGVVASLSGAEAIKLLVGAHDHFHGALLCMDVWETLWLRSKPLTRAVDCPACVKGEYEFLDGIGARATTTFCGRHAVQITPALPVSIDLQALAKRLRSVGHVVANAHMLRVALERYELVAFPDARTMVNGTYDQDVAKKLHTKYVLTDRRHAARRDVSAQ